MSLLTIISDVGYRDYSIGVLKGKIHTENPSVKIIDITHDISPFDNQQTCYVLENSYKYFPKKSVHIVAIDTETSKNNPHLIMLWDDYYFVGANNGIFNILLSDKQPTELIAVDSQYHLYKKYSDFEVLGFIALEILSGKKIIEFGKPFNALKKHTLFKPFLSVDKTYCVAKVIYIDNYGNLVLNIKKETLFLWANDRAIEIKVASKNIKKIGNKYLDVISDKNNNTQNYEGELLARFNSGDYLEIAIFKANPTSTGSAKTLLGLDYNDSITIKFINV